jgi:phosphoribosyl 1,2-cyclic phosphate phosphodiesterase
MEIMKLLVCGSGASEGIPALFCDCEICSRARQRQGREIRTRTAYQLDDAVRIDFGPDLLAQQFKYDLHLDRLEHLFITHEHKDHYTPLNLIYRKSQYVKLNKILHLHATGKLIAMAEKILHDNGSDFDSCMLRGDEITFFKPEEIILEDGTKITVTPIASDHLPAGETCIYDIEYKSRRILIGTDSGIYPPETWEFFQGRRYDLMILDGTSGVLGLRHVHMGRECVVETVERFRQLGTCGPDTLVLVNHFSHNGKMNHSDLEEYYSPHDIHPAWDGLKIDLEQPGRFILPAE